LVCIEDTVNKGGGAIWDLEEIKKIRQVCNEHGLKLHCDGARLFNALEETKVDPKEYAKYFDSISICLSKGLGAPVGSMLIGNADFIAAARRRRKSMGGGMRQAGIIAAGGLFALKNNLQRIAADHQNAKKIGGILEQQKEIKSIFPITTNIVIAQTSKAQGALEYVEHLKSKGILCFPFGPDKIRMVLHLDITEEDIETFRERMG
jgi:threonine aldolase